LAHPKEANMKTILLLSILALCAAGTARAVEETATAADRALDRVIQGTPAGERPDSWITGKVKSALLFHRSVSGLSTEVDTKDGVVTLTGAADNQAQKDLATEYAADIEGVKKVDNRMTVKGERTMEARVDDAEITTQVKSALLTRRSTSALNTSVKTMDGVVTLTGAAKNEAEKELAEKLARGVKGARDVVNRMTVE
jgi:osmotically-inducible protein OsmY